MTNNEEDMPSVKPLYFIHPIDTSTNFLIDIYSFLEQKFGEEIIKIIRPDTSKESIDQCRETVLNLPPTENIVFLGHGASHCLYGAPIDDDRNTTLFSEDELQSIFQKKNLLCLSCNSADLFWRGRKKISAYNVIGFGYIPSAYDEILALRESDSEFLKNITKEVVEEYKKYLVGIIKYSLNDLLKQNLSYFELYLRIRLRINKNISNVLLKGREDEHIELSKRLYDLKLNSKLFRT